MSVRILICLPCCLGWLACVSPPEPRLLVDAIPNDWTAAPTPDGKVMDRWWNSFASAELNARVEAALANNHDLKAAAARVESALAQARIAGAELSPTLALGLDGRRQQQNFIGLPIPGARGGVLQSRATSYGLSLNTSWELDLWGRLRAGRKAARKDWEAAEADWAFARLSLAAQTSKAWLAHVEAFQQLELARATARSYQATREQVRSRYEKGLRSSLDLRLAMSSEANANAIVAQRENAWRATTRQLEILTGRYPKGHSTNDLDLPEMPPPAPAGLPSELLERRPDLVAARQRLVAAGYRQQQAKAALLPRLTLTASGGTSSDELADLLSSKLSVWALAGNLAQPILQGGRLRAGVDHAAARQTEASEHYAAAALRAFGEVEAALAAEQWLAEREREMVKAHEQAQAAARLAEERYQAGLESFVFVLEAQRRAFEMGSQRLLIQRQRMEERVHLHLALGGGFEARRGYQETERAAYE